MTATGIAVQKQRLTRFLFKFFFECFYFPQKTGKENRWGRFFFIFYSKRREQTGKHEQKKKTIFKFIIFIFYRSSVLESINRTTSLLVSPVFERFPTSQHVSQHNIAKHEIVGEASRHFVEFKLCIRNLFFYLKKKLKKQKHKPKKNSPLCVFNCIFSIERQIKFAHIYTGIYIYIYCVTSGSP